MRKGGLNFFDSIATPAEAFLFRSNSCCVRNEEVAVGVALNMGLGGVVGLAVDEGTVVLSGVGPEVKRSNRKSN